MYNIKRSSPFLINQVQVARSIFKGDYIKVNVRSNINKGIEGGSASFSIRRALKSAFGESLERTSLYINSGNIKEDEVLGYDFTKDSFTKVPLQRILLISNSPLLKNKNFDFNDTCGVASHVNSYRTIEAGFLEFIERQSFVFNWLTKSKGEKIDISNFSDPRTINLVNKAGNYIDNIYAFNISISPNVFVILCLGVGSKHVGIGLNAGWSAESTFQGAMEELFQFFGLQKNKYDIKLSNSDNIGKLLGSNFIDEEDPQYYAKSFVKNFGKEKLMNEYSYLFNSIKLDELYKEEPQNIRDLTSIIKKTGKELMIDIKMTFIPSKVENIPIKIVKFLSDEGFWHMKTEIIDTNKVTLLKGKSLPNKGRLLPFP